jgi:hypothetical protein
MRTTGNHVADGVFHLDEHFAVTAPELEHCDICKDLAPNCTIIPESLERFCEDCIMNASIAFWVKWASSPEDLMNILTVLFTKKRIQIMSEEIKAKTLKELKLIPYQGSSVYALGNSGFIICFYDTDLREHFITQIWPSVEAVLKRNQYDIRQVKVSLTQNMSTEVNITAYPFDFPKEHIPRDIGPGTV